MRPEAAEYILRDSFEEGAKEAEEQGRYVIYSQDNELFLDIDTEEALNDLDDRVEPLIRWGWLEGGKEIRVSKSGRPHRHIRYKLTRPFSVLDRILLQLYLGSDPVKELLAYKRLIDGVAENPIRLFMIFPFDEFADKPVGADV